MSDENWYKPDNIDEVISPALLFFPDRISRNIDQMIRISGNPARLWPHVKTHKNAEIIGMQLDAGIDKFKCSTLAEAELLGKCGAKEALLAMQPTEIHLKYFLELARTYPNTSFSTLTDNEHTLHRISEAAQSSGKSVKLWLDVNNGMNRTGIIPDEKAEQLFEQMVLDPWIDCQGIHVYDGHIKEADLDERTMLCQTSLKGVLDMRNRLISKKINIGKIIAGGSPTFGLHAENPDLELSPGTTLLWDAGYGSKYTDLPFEPAAVLLTRVVSKPAPGWVCTDLGHKSVASEMDFPRVKLLNLDTCQQVSQSEEHLVLKCEDTNHPSIGTSLFALPLHICPTVAKYGSASVVRDGKIVESWEISARDHGLPTNSSLS